MSAGGRTHFRWAVGIENTAIGVPIRHGGRTLDEYELTEHDLRFREDLDLAASLGVDTIRYGVPWYSANPAAGVFDWRWADAAIEHAAVRLGLTVVADLVHYGVPAWIENGFADERYPIAVAEYAAAFAERYGDVVTHVTPLNEPTITAAFCGEFGGWPPYLTGPHGWVTVALAIADGIQRTVRAVRSVRPGTQIVHVEAAKVVRDGPPSLEDQRRIVRLRSLLPTDLVTGRVDSSHPLASWLVAHGGSERRIADLAASGVGLDVIGVNFYPDFSVREVVRHRGALVEVAGGGTASDLVTALRDIHARYGRPVFVSETSTDGGTDRHLSWLAESVAAVEAAGEAGLPVWGYTWWPLFDFVDWGIAAGGYAFEDFLVRQDRSDGRTDLVPLPSPGVEAGSSDGVAAWLRRMGLWRLEPGRGGLVRTETPAADAYRRVIETRRRMRQIADATMPAARDAAVTRTGDGPP